MLSHAIPILVELGLFSFFYSHQPVTELLMLIMTLTIMAVAVFIASLLVLALRAVATPRTLACLPGSSPSVLGRPLLFPAVINHTRVSPIKNHFQHRVLFIGIPVGLRGRIGGLLSIDESKFTEAPDPAGSIPRRRDFQSWFTTWFSFDPQRYLQRGDNHLGLRNKLDQFLHTQVRTR